MAQAAILHKARRPPIVQYAQRQAVLARRMHGRRPRPSALWQRFGPVTAFGLCVGAAYMPPAKRCVYHPLPGCMVCVSHGRAGVHARRTLYNFKKLSVRRAKSPALQMGVNGHISHKPCTGHTPAGRHVCLPYKHPVPRTRAQNVTLGRTSAHPFLHAAAKNAGRRTGKNRAFCPLPTARLAGIIGA